MPKTLDQQTLNERSQHLLKLLVSHYIRDGQPVGSRTLSRDPELDFSAATIRNIMSDLEELGLISAPHTSAGRIPTVRGYRMFIDTLLQVKPLERDEVRRLREHLLQAEQDNQPLMKQASDLLSDLTRMVGVVMLPKPDTQALRHIEFLPLSNKRVLVITVVHPHEVQNRIIYTEHEYSASELQQASNYLNEAFTGRDINTVRNKLLRELREVHDNMNQLMKVVMDVAEKSFDYTESGDFVLSGQHNLLDGNAVLSADKLRELFETFNRKQSILSLLDKALKAEGIKIFIGEESGSQALESCSVVTAPYQVDGQVLGVLGVVGPTRMPYERVIPIVDITAQLLGKAFHQA
jgi:heat-inducible transcriptional repressor